MRYPYGYLKRTEGEDGEEVDVYIGPDESVPYAFVVHQLRAPDFEAFDEDKVMLGFTSAEEAEAAYREHYNKDGFFGGMSAISLEHLYRIMKADGNVRAWRQVQRDADNAGFPHAAAGRAAVAAAVARVEDRRFPGSRPSLTLPDGRTARRTSSEPGREVWQVGDARGTVERVVQLSPLGKAPWYASDVDLQDDALAAAFVEFYRARAPDVDALEKAGSLLDLLPADALVSRQTMRDLDALPLPPSLAVLSESALEGMCVRCGACCHPAIDLGHTKLVVPELPCRHLSWDEQPGETPVSRCDVYGERHEVAKEWCASLPRAIARGVLPVTCPYVVGLEGYEPGREFSVPLAKSLRAEIVDLVGNQPVPPWVKVDDVARYVDGDA